MTDVAEIKAASISLDSKYRQESGRVYLTGLQALVRVPIDQMRADRARGLSTGGFISGYPGSPLAGFDLECKTREGLLEEMNIVFRPGLNEELAATSVMGSQIAEQFGSLKYDGVVGYWYGKAPGLDRAADAIRHANYYGTTRTGGAVAYVGDDPTCKSSSIPSLSDGLLADLNLPTLYPGTVQEVLDFGRHAVELSRTSSLWTGLKVVTPVADGAGTAIVDAGRVVPVFPVDDAGNPLGRSQPASLSPMGILQVEREIFEVRLPAALEYGRLNKINEITVRSSDDWIGIIAAGNVYYETIEALRQLGLDKDDLGRRGIRLLRLGMVYPLDPVLLREFADGLDEVIVVEEKRGRIEASLREALYGTALQPRIVGKRDENGRPILPAHGAVDADTLAGPLYAQLSRRIDASVLKAPIAPVTRIDLPVIPRTPYFCSGCPHNTSLRVPEDAKVGAGIGCHSMVAFMSPDLVGEVTGITQMGGEGTQWLGASSFVETDHLFQNLGEGTFFHSGEMAVRASVAAGSHITYKILYNRAVAMTGGQDAEGALEVPDMARMLASVGVAKIIITAEDTHRYRKVKLPEVATVMDRNAILEAQEILRNTPGTTVLIHDQQCAAEARRLRKRGQQVEPATRVLINERVCEGCGDCGMKSNCLSVRPVDTEFGSKTEIDQSTCNKDYSCLRGDCPSFVAVEPRKARRLRLRRSAKNGEGAVETKKVSASLPERDLPEPRTVVDDSDFRMRMPGIGGTGVITVAQIVGTAAMLAGRYVTEMDQTGLAQKGGAVVSDLRITRTPMDTSSKIPAGAVDLYLVFDPVVAVGPANLSGLSKDRTVVVASDSVVPTGSMIGTGRRQVSTGAMIAKLDERSRSELNVVADTAEITRKLFGRSTGANIFALGIAYQRGALPVPAEAIRSAIELNGVAIKANLAAFEWGRWYVEDRSVVDDAIRVVAESLHVDEVAPPEVNPPHPERLAVLSGYSFGGELGRLVAVRAPDLVDYQDEKYARQFLDLVDRVRRIEERIGVDSSTLSESVAKGLYKLMAYKDEYEVARLHLEEAARAAVEEVARGEDVKVSWYLHPPVLRAMGMDRKLKLGPWFKPAYVALRSMRKVRGTPLDLFGMAEVRKVERRLVAEYIEMLDDFERRLTRESYGTAVALAELPDMVRGYEFIKLDNVARYEEKRALLLSEFVGFDGRRSGTSAATTRG